MKYVKMLLLGASLVVPVAVSAQQDRRQNEQQRIARLQCLANSIHPVIAAHDIGLVNPNPLRLLRKINH